LVFFFEFPIPLWSGEIPPHPPPLFPLLFSTRLGLDFFVVIFFPWASRGELVFFSDPVVSLSSRHPVCSFLLFIPPLFFWGGGGGFPLGRLVFPSHRIDSFLLRSFPLFPHRHKVIFSLSDCPDGPAPRDASALSVPSWVHDPWPSLWPSLF